MSKATDYVKAVMAPKPEQPEFKTIDPRLRFVVNLHGGMSIIHESWSTRITADQAIVLADWIYETFADTEEII